MAFAKTSYALLPVVYIERVALFVFFAAMLRLEVDLPHVKQKTDWDCGLACSLMVLQKVLGNKFEEMTFEDICARKGFASSVWTVDIASILTEYNVEYVFFTKTLGADPRYQNNSFYHGTFDLDQMRVNRLFQLAPELGIKVEKRSLSVDCIISQLARGYVAIVLVNSNTLHCDWCGIGGSSPLALVLEYCNCVSPMKDYCGHFVVLCGFDREKGCFYYKNPSFDEALCCVQFKSFDLARQCYGTDEDIIFVRVEQGFSKDKTQLTELLSN